MVYGIIITRYLSRKYQKLSQSFVKVLLHSVVQEASVRIGIKGSWRLWFGKWVLYFIECYISYIRSLKYSGLWHWVRKYVVTWPGQSATSVQWRLWNSAQLLMSRVLFFFSVRSTFPHWAMMKIRMIFTELITICPSSIHIKIITKLLKLGCRTALQRRWSLRKWRVFVAYLFWLPLPEWVKLFPGMFHINETHLKHLLR